MKIHLLKMALAVLLPIALVGQTYSGTAAQTQTVDVGLFVADNVPGIDTKTCTIDRPDGDVSLVAVDDDGTATKFEIPTGEAATITRSGVETPGCFFEFSISLYDSTTYRFEIDGQLVGSGNLVLMTRLGVQLVWGDASGTPATPPAPDTVGPVEIAIWQAEVVSADIDDAPNGSIYKYRLFVTVDVTNLGSKRFVSRNVELAVVTSDGTIISEDRLESIETQNLLGQGLGIHKEAQAREYTFVFNMPRDWDASDVGEVIEGWRFVISYRGEQVEIPIDIHFAG